MADAETISPAVEPIGWSEGQPSDPQPRLADLIARNEALRRAADLHNDLVDLVLGERGVAAMVDRLAAAVGNPVALADQLFHLLASSPSGEHGDRHRREAVAHGGTAR